VIISTAVKEKKKAGGKIVEGWIDRKETVGVVGWWRLSLPCPRPTIDNGNTRENFKASRGNKKENKNKAIADPVKLAF
jgi:hypothetical protein